MGLRIVTDVTRIVKRPYMLIKTNSCFLVVVSVPLSLNV